LLTKKRADFLLFKMCIELMIKKEHLTIQGLQKMLAIRASMNKGLSKVLKRVFSPLNHSVGAKGGIIPVDRPIFKIEIISKPNWISGFSSGESCFDVRIIKNKSGSQVQLRFIISQDERNRTLLNLIIEYLNSGILQTFINKVVLTILNYDDILNVIIPFFDKYPILGIKPLDYNDFKLIAYLLKEETHLTVEGLEQIYKIKAGMNTNRIQSNWDIDRKTYLINSGNSKINQLANDTSNYMTKNRRNYSTKAQSNVLDPLWVTGFVDAEGCFSIIIEISEPLKWKVRTSFEMIIYYK